MPQSRNIALLGLLASLALGLLGCAGGPQKSMAPGPQVRLVGSVLAVDLSGRSIEMTDKGMRHTVHIASDATIQSGRTPRDLAELRRGDRIVIVSRDSAGRATWIAVSGPPLKRPSETGKD